MARRGAYAKGVAKREEILDAALAVVAREGYHGASVKELAEAVGLSQAGLLHYFASKDELFQAILAKRDERDALLGADADAADPLEDMSELVRHNQTVPGLVELFARQAGAATDPNHPSHEFFADRYRGLRERFTGIIAERQRAGELDDRVPAESLAALAVAVMDGLQEQWLLGVEPDMAARLDDLWTLLRIRP